MLFDGPLPATRTIFKSPQLRNLFRQWDAQIEAYIARLEGGKDFDNNRGAVWKPWSVALGQKLRHHCLD